MSLYSNMSLQSEEIGQIMAVSPLFLLAPKIDVFHRHSMDLNTLWWRVGCQWVNKIFLIWTAHSYQVLFKWCPRLPWTAWPNHGSSSICFHAKTHGTQVWESRHHSPEDMYIYNIIIIYKYYKLSEPRSLLTNGCPDCSSEATVNLSQFRLMSIQETTHTGQCLA